MTVSLLIGLGLAVATPTPAPNPAHLFKSAEQALAAGRIEQAKLMASSASAAGFRGAALDRLVADIAYAAGNYDQALAGYEQLLRVAPDDQISLQRAGIAAIKLGRLRQAGALIRRATSRPTASWRAWNARGVLADLEGDWPEADDAYARAAALAPRKAEIVNNRAWSRLLRGEWAHALEDLERAATLDPSSSRIANNLELARAALAADLPERTAGESNASWAERLNDAGVAAELLGEKEKAVAAFTQALDASGTWYARAANNLQAAMGQ
jgi:Flp pilus assembly protein TadD